jgi:hypothetical protein
MDSVNFRIFREPVAWLLIAFLCLGLGVVTARQLVVIERIEALNGHFARHESAIKDFESRIRVIEHEADTIKSGAK